MKWEAARKWGDDMDAGLIILAGGRSERMGCDKALLPYKGQTFLNGIVNKGIRAGFKQIILSTNNPEKYKNVLKEVTFARDIFISAGPLGGIHAGLLASKYYYNFIAPCDTPLLSFNQLEEFYEKIKGKDAAVAVCEGKIEPLLGMYSKKCTGPIECLLKDNNRKVRKIYNMVSTVYVEIKNKKELYNINTPEDYENNCLE